MSGSILVVDEAEAKRLGFWSVAFMLLVFTYWFAAAIYMEIGHANHDMHKVGRVCARVGTYCATDQQRMEHHPERVVQVSHPHLFAEQPLSA